MTTPDCLGRPEPQTVAPQHLLEATMLWPEKPKFSLFNSCRLQYFNSAHAYSSITELCRHSSTCKHMSVLFYKQNT